MEKNWLEARLAEGRSIEASRRSSARCLDGRLLGEEAWPALAARPPSRARGGVELAVLQELVERGMSVRQIAEEVGLGFASVRHWLAKYGLRTDPLHYVRRDGDKPPSVPRECPRHGWTDYLRSGARGFYRCPRCSMERVAARRR